MLVLNMRTCSLVLVNSVNTTLYTMYSIRDPYSSSVLLYDMHIHEEENSTDSASLSLSALPATSYYDDAQSIYYGRHGHAYFFL